MGWFETFILGIVQGLTEFLPVSSTGHLVVAQSLLGWEETGQYISLDIFLHLSTIIAVIVFFRRDIAVIFRGLFKPASPEDRRSAMHLVFMIFLGIVATSVVYFLFKQLFEDVYGNVRSVGVAFLITAVFLAAASLKGRGSMSEGDLRWWHALLIGVAQGIAITPGISRSGITICAALLIGLAPAPAFRFSFLLSIPTIILAWLYDVATNPGALVTLIGLAPGPAFRFSFLLSNPIIILAWLYSFATNPGALVTLGGQAGPLALGFAVAFISALFAVLILKNFVLRNWLWVFSIYLLPVGIITIVFL